MVPSATGARPSDVEGTCEDARIADTGCPAVWQTAVGVTPNNYCIRNCHSEYLNLRDHVTEDIEISERY
jgi:hypothetical protein